MPTRRRQILLLAIPLVVFVAWMHWWAALDFPLEGEICAAPQNSCGNYNVVIYSLWLLAKALDHWSALITAIAAASIALLVWTFRRSSEQMWITANRFATLAERALAELAHPFVGIQIVRTGLKFYLCKPLGNQAHPAFLEDGELTFHLINCGRAAVTVTEMADGFVVCNSGEMPALAKIKGRNTPFGVILAANGKSRCSTRVPSDGISENEWLTFAVGEGDLYFGGFVRFRDIFDRRHISVFCLKFSKSDRLFKFEGDRQYNYTYEEN